MSTHLTPLWLSPAVVSDLGWTLIHFLWQGAALALLLEGLLLSCKDARRRYNAAFAVLLGMAAAPVATFLFIHRASVSGTSLLFDSLAASSPFAVIDDAMLAPAANWPWMNWLVLAWIAGVTFLSVRLIGGWYAADALKRRGTTDLPDSLRRRCEQLAAKLGIARTVRFLQSAVVEAPAVIGLLRPVVLIPASAIIGLTSAQLEAVIIHELAHIRRLDALVNLLQMMVETALFYHPAVWWVGRRMRIERENCCDDVAVAVSGDALGYARALASLEEWRSPAPMMAASGGALKERIARLLGLRVKASGASTAGAAAIALLCLAGCVVAKATPENATSAPAAVSVAANEPQPAAPAMPATPAITIQPLVPPPPAVAAAPALPALPEAPAHRHAEQRREELALAPEDQSYVEAMQTAGLRDISANQLLALKHLGVTPDYVKGLVDAGLRVRSEQVVALKGLGIDGAYVRAMRAAGIEASTSQLIAMAGAGVTPEFARTVRAAWPDATARDLISMHAQGIGASDAAGFRQLGLADVSLHQIAGFKAVGVTPDYVRALQAAGLDLKQVSGHELTAYKATGVTPELVKTLNSLGLVDLTPRDYLTAKVRGLTPEFIAEVRNHHFTNLSFRQLLAFKDANVF